MDAARLPLVLEALGIGEFGESVYRAVLAAPDASVAGVAAVVRATPRRVGRALAELVELGLVRRLDGRRYVPLPPEAAIDMLVHRRRAELDRVRGAAAELVDAFRLRDLQARPEGLVEIVAGTEAVRKRSVEFEYGQRSEILSFDRPPYATPPAGYDEVGTERALLERGVEMRIIYDAEALQMPGRLRTVTQLVGLGERARTLPGLPLKLYVYDRRLALIPLAANRPTDAMAIVHRSALLDALVALFEAYWERARPVVTGAGDDDLSPRDAEVLALLGTGLTDQAIARRLGVSLRTARRRINAIMATVHGSTRFQTGAAAAHRGWL
jgi:DNA-binding CsgD family transcriptional regulator